MRPDTLTCSAVLLLPRWSPSTTRTETTPHQVTSLPHDLSVSHHHRVLLRPPSHRIRRRLPRQCGPGGAEAAGVGVRGGRRPWRIWASRRRRPRCARWRSCSRSRSSSHPSHPSNLTTSRGSRWRDPPRNLAISLAVVNLRQLADGSGKPWLAFSVWLQATSPFSFPPPLWDLIRCFSFGCNWVRDVDHSGTRPESSIPSLSDSGTCDQGLVTCLRVCELACYCVTSEKWVIRFNFAWGTYRQFVHEKWCYGLKLCAAIFWSVSAI